MSAARRALLVALLCGGPAWAQPDRREPHVGYACPAGGRRGTVVRVTVGGQGLRGVSAVHFTGQGVHGRVLRHYPPLRVIRPEQRAALVETMRSLVAERWSELQKDGRVGPVPPWRELLPPGGGRARGGGAEGATAPEAAGLPEHPLLYDLEGKSLRELLHVRHALAGLRRGPPNAQIAESVLVEVTIERDAAPGARELRLGGPAGLTNPLVFEVGALAEACELECNDPGAVDPLPADPPLELPVVLNGQIMPGDVDRFRFRARQGQKLVVETHARRLIPYLADAVPGWFQATVALYDDRGRELAFADDYRFDPDPVLFYEVPADGVYELEVRDALYRGRQDFVYRIRIGELPFITSIFPLGTRAGQKRYVAVEGWNLATSRLLLDPADDAQGVRQRCLGLGAHSSNPVTYAVDPRPVDAETEPNDTPAGAQRITLPRIVDGRIAQPGDVDVFRFRGRAGDEIVAEVHARRLHSPLDSLLRLLDAAGSVLAWNDDFGHADGHLHLEPGLLTHSADSYLRARLPADGVYCVQVSDAQGQGGPAFGYRLRIGPPQPDFAVRVTPASLNVPAGGVAPITAYALRLDGFDGPIELALDGAPPGFALAGARIPPGCDRVRMTVAGPWRRPDGPVALRLVARAQVGPETVSHPVVPAEDLMQAFLYRHLAPAAELLVAVVGGRLPAAEVPVGTGPVQIPAGGTVEVPVRLPARALARPLEIVLCEPPAGVVLEQVTRHPDGLVLVLKADGAAGRPGLAGNLIFEGFAEVARPKRGGGTAEKVRVSAGYLPAIPFEVSAR